MEQEPKPVVKVRDDAKIRIESADAPCERRAKKQAARLAEQVGPAADAAAQDRARRDHAAAATTIVTRHEGARTAVDNAAGAEHQREALVAIGLEHCDLARQAIGRDQIIVRQQLEIAPASEPQAA